DGTIYVLTQEIRATPVTGWDSLRTPVLEEFVAVLSPDGRERKRFSLLEALVGTPFLREKTAGASVNVVGDVLHSNTVHPVSEGFAARHEGVSAGDLMVCLRNLNLVAVLDTDTGKFVWATTGPWYLPHDPDPLDDGGIMIFDNVFARGPTAGSRVVEFDPADGLVRWAYAGNERDPLRSDVRATSQLLPNGNVLITESDYGRILEVTREGMVVWEYVNPVRGGEREELVPVVCGVRRYSSEELPFATSRAVASDRRAFAR
ncbi:MAG TPA: arylsulfotransferase family protein, partial [Planctomycetaceae bacterium]